MGLSSGMNNYKTYLLSHKNYSLHLTIAMD
jgi:hypothetical protein